MKRLLQLIAAESDRMSALAGGRIAIDPPLFLSRRADLLLADPGLWSPNRHSRLLPCRDGWLAVSLARSDDIDLVPAWTGKPVSVDPWQAVAQAAVRQSVADMLQAGIDLHLPVARVGEAVPQTRSALPHRGREEGIVLDLSALWAGPCCGGLLADAGLPVVKAESPLRPDPTPVHTPVLDARLNGRKTRLQVGFPSAELQALIASARVLITSGRPHALARIGLNKAELFAANPGLLWVAITAHGWSGEAGLRVGFGDDCAAAGGLLRMENGEPRFLGDALADPLTGLRAARLVLEALDAGQGGLLDISLAGTAADFARQRLA